MIFLVLLYFAPMIFCFLISYVIYKTYDEHCDVPPLAILTLGIIPAINLFGLTALEDKNIMSSISEVYGVSFGDENIAVIKEKHKKILKDQKVKRQIEIAEYKLKREKTKVLKKLGINEDRWEQILEASEEPAEFPTCREDITGDSR